MILLVSGIKTLHRAMHKFEKMVKCTAASKLVCLYVYILCVCLYISVFWLAESLFQPCNILVITELQPLHRFYHSARVWYITMWYGCISACFDYPQTNHCRADIQSYCTATSVILLIYRLSNMLVWCSSVPVLKTILQLNICVQTRMKRKLKRAVFIWNINLLWHYKCRYCHFSSIKCILAELNYYCCFNYCNAIKTLNKIIIIILITATQFKLSVCTCGRIDNKADFDFDYWPNNL